MGTSVLVTPTPNVTDVTNAPATDLYGDPQFLDTVHLEYYARRDAWIREERRLMGGDEVLTELTNFDWEDKNGAHYRGRQSKAVYPNIGLQHAATITGHLAKHRPLPNKGMDFGTLGQVRARDKINSTPTRGELIWYNINGVGNDGAQFDAWLDDVDIRAQATGHRWLMVESPTSRPTNYNDELRGMRPFAVEYSPLLVTNWYFANGQLRWAVVRVQTQAMKVVNGVFDVRYVNRLGYYLLVADGEDSLGDQYREGGWWTFTPERRFIAHERWTNTLGQIPLFRHFGRMSTGTTSNPASSASDTMELGQLAISMMNARSAREFDFWDACASKVYFLGADSEVMKVVVDGWSSSNLIAVPPKRNEDGTSTPVTVHDGSTGAVISTVADALEKAQWEMARELSISKVTSTPNSSGASKDAGFAEASAPDLTRRAILREQTENMLLYFFELRFGAQTPRAYALWPREFDLEPLVDDIDAMFDTLRRSSVTSGTMEVELILQSLVERGLITDTATLATIKDELSQAFLDKQAQSNMDKAILQGKVAGNPLTGAAGAASAAATADANSLGGGQGVDPGQPRIPRLPNDPPRDANAIPQLTPPPAPGASNAPPHAAAPNAPPHANPFAAHDSNNPPPATHDAAGVPIRPHLLPPAHGSSAPAPAPLSGPVSSPAPSPHRVPPFQSGAPDDRAPGRATDSGVPAQPNGGGDSGHGPAIADILAQLAAIRDQLAKPEPDTDDGPMMAQLAALSAQLQALMTLVSASVAAESSEVEPPAPRSDVVVVSMPPERGGGNLVATVNRGLDSLISTITLTRTNEAP
jgi:hypothetical protein